MKRKTCTSMSLTSFRERFKLLRKWDYICVVCGTGFRNVACVSVEHIIPASVMQQRGLGGRRTRNNLAPSHWRCNKVKGLSSLLEASKRIEQIKADSKMSDEQFEDWVNRRIPARNVPAYALLPIVDAEWYCFL